MANVLTTTLPIGHQFGLVQSATGVPIEVEVQAGAAGVDASAVTYTPADPTDWPIPPPGNVATALDILADPRAGILTNAIALGPATQLILSTLGFTPLKSGIFLIWAEAQLDGTGTAAGVATCTIDVDGVAATQPIGMGYAPGTWSAMPSNFHLAVLNRAVPHLFRAIFDTNSAALASIAIGKAKLMAIEL